MDQHRDKWRPRCTTGHKLKDGKAHDDEIKCHPVNVDGTQDRDLGVNDGASFASNPNIPDTDYATQKNAAIANERDRKWDDDIK